MKISYDWLIQYLDTKLSLKDICKILTDSGLEVGNYHKINDLDRILERVILGEIRYFQVHPYDINFNILKVNIGKYHNLQIICCDTNFYIGKKVIIAPIGAYIFDNTGEQKKIKIITINGIYSYGRLCSSINIGLKKKTILFLQKKKLLGTSTKKIFNIKKDYSISIEITPNRIDTISHWGIARELYTILKTKKYPAILNKPSIKRFHSSMNFNNLLISLKNIKNCKRYSGCIISGVKIAPSPVWLQQRLQCIGIHPNNNIIDIINFVMHELGQPLSVFDIESIDGNEIHIKTLQENILSNVLEDTNFRINSKDLILYDAKKIIGLAGVLNSNIQETTKVVFLQSAYFEPKNIRKSIKNHKINSYSSFFFDRGVDPDQIVYVLKRAAILIKEIAGGEIYTPIDIYPKHMLHFETTIRGKQISRILGKKVSKQSIKKIISLLEIDILMEKRQSLYVSIPFYRVDVFREVDIIEDILRIYGYNKIKISNNLYFSIYRNIEKKNNYHNYENYFSTILLAQGFYETVSLSLTRKDYTNPFKHIKLSTIRLLNPLNKEIAVMRESLIFGLLEIISFNIKRKNLKLKIFEWGKTYSKREEKYNENSILGIMISGNDHKDHWLHTTGMYSFFYLKGVIEGLLKKNGLINTKQKIKEDASLENALCIYHNHDLIARIGRIKNKVIELFDLKQDVFYAEIYYTSILNKIQNSSIHFEPICQLPGARRDLAILLDKCISFEEIYQYLKSIKEEIIKDIQLFDVYENYNFLNYKKSYALSFYLENRNKNITEIEIVKTMENIKNTLNKKFGIQIR